MEQILSMFRVQVTECKLNRLEGRILRLRRLEILNLSENHIREVPRSVADMAALTELVLAGNMIASLPAHLFDGKINATLRKLDLARNQVSYTQPIVLRMFSLK
jgi:LRR-repeat protein 1